MEEMGLWREGGRVCGRKDGGEGGRGGRVSR